MDSGDIIGLITTGTLGLAVVVMSVILRTGKGAFLIAGYNTLSKREKEKYDREALCKFMGKILLPIGILTPLIAVSGIYRVSWFPFLYVAAVFGLVLFAAVYCNTGDRFRK